MQLKQEKQKTAEINKEMLKYKKAFEHEKNDKKDIEKAYKKQIIREIEAHHHNSM